MKQQKLLTNRTYYYDLLRILASFAVVIIHISSQNWHNAEVDSLAWNMFNIYDSIARWAVPIFTMLSGALFLNGSQTMERICKKNIFRIAAAFTFWSLIYAVVDYTRGSGVRGLMESFGHYHLWYLVIIIGLYLIIPCLRKIMESASLTKYFLLLALIFNFIVPQCLTLLSFVSEGASSMANTVLEQMNFHFALGYSGYFVCGAYLSRINISKKAEKIIYILGILGFLSTILLTVVFSNYYGKSGAVFYGYFTLNVLLESIGVFVFFKKHCALDGYSDKIRLWVQKLAKYSFGIYLVHVLIIEQLDKRIGWNTMSLHPVLAVPVNGIIVFGISLIISAFLNSLPVFRKYIV